MGKVEPTAGRDCRPGQEPESGSMADHGYVKKPWLP